jgi:geranylgeranyl pyrophosphate synthase
LERIEPQLNLDDRLKSIGEKIDFSWSRLNISSEYSELLHLALKSDGGGDTAPARHTGRWGLLPGLCCQAAGGEASQADVIAAAWMVFYAAADIMDSIQDQDEPAAWWKEAGPAAALSAATGLFFFASSLLNQIYTQEVPPRIAAQLVEDFYLGFLKMSSGQYDDLTHPHATLEQFWEIASEKSGAFFALACRAGASLASKNRQNIESYAQFGKYLGLLIQILDDLEELKTLTSSVSADRVDKIRRSLPMVYALNVYPPSSKEKLGLYLREAVRDPGAAKQAFQMIEGSGAVIYLLTEIERHRDLAVKSLMAAHARQPARDILTSFVNQLGIPE